MRKPFTAMRLASAVAIVVASQVTTAAVLEEVIVTAQKRAESLQDVPISVSAVSGQKIQEAGIHSMTALAAYVPNLHIAEAPVNTNIYMRGVGSGNNQAFEQSVGMYIDGVYMGRGRQYRSPFMDVDRVEVLRGPQGTLFGKNTVAGAISVTSSSAKLDEEFNGSITASLEQNEGKVVEGFFSGAVSETLALRFAYKFRETDGYIDNQYLNQDEAQVEEKIFRVSAFWQPTDDIDVTIKYGKSDYDRVGQLSYVDRYLAPAELAAQFPNASDFAKTAYAVNNVFYPELAQLAGQKYTALRDNGTGVDRKTLSIGQNVDGSDNTTDNFSMTANISLGEYTLTSVTGYSAYDFVDGADVDWLPVSFIARDDEQDFNQKSQEIRITSPAGERFEYIGGVYYEEQEMNFDRRVTIDASFDGLLGKILPVESLFTALSAGTWNATQSARDHTYNLETKSFALFGQGTFNVTDDLRVTFGLRYTEEDKDVRSVQFLSDTITGIGVKSTNITGAAIVGGAFGAYARDLNESRSTDKWIPSANVQWDISEDSMLYFTVSEGFKSGGFSAADNGKPKDIDARACTNTCTVAHDDFEFGDEEVLAYEIGGKHSLLDGAMTANWAAFRTEYDNQQVSTFDGVGFVVANAAQSLIQGLEADIRWQAHDDLLVGWSAAYLDAAYDQYKNAPCTAATIDATAGACSQDLSGHVTTFAPKYSSSLFFDYMTEVGDNLQYFLSADLNYSAEYSTAGDADPLDYQKSYNKIGIRTGIRSADDVWEVSLYGRNITDEAVAMIRFDVPVLAGSHATTADEGRVWGAKVRYSF